MEHLASEIHNPPSSQEIVPEDLSTLSSAALIQRYLDAKELRADIKEEVMFAARGGNKTQARQVMETELRDMNAQILDPLRKELRRRYDQEIDFRQERLKVIGNRVESSQIPIIEFVKSQKQFGELVDW